MIRRNKGGTAEFFRPLQNLSAEDFFSLTRPSRSGGKDDQKSGRSRYPGEELLRSDIRKGQLFIEEFDGAIHGVFAFVLGEDPTYGKIEDGGWLSDQPYGTIHRVASDGCRSGFLKRITEYCEEITGHIRIDTHEENQTMRRSILRNGFTRCGIIFAADGSPRIAYEKVQ